MSKNPDDKKVDNRKVFRVSTLEVWRNDIYVLATDGSNAVDLVKSGNGEAGSTARSFEFLHVIDSDEWDVDSEKCLLEEYINIDWWDKLLRRSERRTE